MTSPFTGPSPSFDSALVLTTSLRRVLRLISEYNYYSRGISPLIHTKRSPGGEGLRPKLSYTIPLLALDYYNIALVR